MAIPSDEFVTHVVPGVGATRVSQRRARDVFLPPPPRVPPGPREGFIVAFGPIDGITSRRALSSNFYFQCPPSDTFPVDFTWTWNDFGTISGGMHSNPNYPNLTTIQFDSMFVLEDGVNTDLVISHSQESVFARARLLKALGNSMTPFAMQVGSAQAMGEWEPLGRSAQAQIAVTLRSFHWESRAGEPDTRYFTIQVTEFPDAPLLQKIVPPPLPGSQGRPKSGTTSQGQKVLHTFDPNDLPPGHQTLSGLAIWAYNSATAWPQIVRATGKALEGISPNQNLRIALGKRKPPVKIIVPERKKHPNDKAKNT